MNTDEIAAAFEVIFEQALVYHGFTDYLRDYELIADVPTGWSSALGIPFHEARIQTEAHDISLLFSGLIVTRVETGWTPFVVEDGDRPDFKTPLA